jgi:hypothetical protein
MAALCLCLGAALLVSAPAAAQDLEPPTLRLGEVMPGGVRTTATQSWGTFGFKVTNLTDTDRQARVVIVFPRRPEVRYARDLSVPARSTVSSWLLVGPAPGEAGPALCDIQPQLYDRTDGTERLIRPDDDPRSRVSGVLYRPRDPSTAIFLDDEAPQEEGFGRLPRPPSPSEEAVTLALTFRQARKWSVHLTTVRPGSLPATPEAYDGIDLLIVASGRVADDPVGMQALRRWLAGGGRVWVMLDLVDVEAVAPLLGEALDFQVVDRVSLTRFQVESSPSGPRAEQRHERPVTFARVLLPPGERPRHTVEGWPAWFARPVGRGEVIFTTLGPRAWYRDRIRTDPPSPYDLYPSLPIPEPPLEALAKELQPPSDAAKFRVEAFQPLLTQEIGYTIPGRPTVGLVFVALLAVPLVLWVVLRRSRRLELRGWVGPAAALAATGALLALGESSRRSAPPTVAVGEVVDAVPGTSEASVHGLLAAYRPDEGPAEVGAGQGGFFDLNMAGIEAQPRRFTLTDLDAWHWEDLALPAGVRLAPFHTTVSTGEPVAAVARFGPDGLEGRVTAGPFRDLDDALLHTPGSRNLAVHLRPDGTFSAGPGDVLPPGQFLAGAALSDRQQGQQEVYREALKQPPLEFGENRPVLMAWARPVDPHFDLVPGARLVGDALLRMPLRLGRPAPGTRVAVPGLLVPCRRIFETGAGQPTRESSQRADMHLRFQLPPEVLPLKVDRARLVAKVDAPGRQVTVRGRDGDQLGAPHQFDSPIDPIRVDITEARWLQPDKEGGLHVNLAISEVDGGGLSGAGRKWTIEYLELEVVGQAE